MFTLLIVWFALSMIVILSLAVAASRPVPEPDGDYGDYGDYRDYGDGGDYGD